MAVSQDRERLLVVEDEAHLAAGLKLNLELEGYRVDVAPSAREAGQRLLSSEGYDALVLDVMLPDMNGFDLCKRLRDSGNFVPVLMLTARASADDRVRGLEAGADDYLVKPFAFAELEARLEAVLRRPADAAPASETQLVCGDLTLDLIAREAARGARKVQLQPREFQMLEFLMRRQGRVVTRTMLLEGVWDYRFDPRTNVIDVHISRLRRKIDAEGEPQLIRTVRGAGYMMSAEG